MTCFTLTKPLIINELGATSGERGIRTPVKTRYHTAFQKLLVNHPRISTNVYKSLNFQSLKLCTSGILFYKFLECALVSERLVFG